MPTSEAHRCSRRALAGEIMVVRIKSQQGRSPAQHHMSSQPLVSVITPTYNGAHFLPETIDSALAQDYQNLEIIVADDGSTDHTQHVLDRYRERVRVLTLPHRGENSARNAAIAVSSGSYVAFLDHDDLWLPTKVSEQVRALEAHPTAGLSHTAWVEFGEAHPQQIHLHEPATKYHGRCFETIFRKNGVGALTAMIRRAALPSYVFYEDIQICADYALWLDVLFHHEAFYIPRVLGKHRRHSGQITHGRRIRWKVYEAVSRIRLLDRMRDEMSDDMREDLRMWTLEQLRAATYELHEQGDYGWAALGFDLLHRYGYASPWHHRFQATVFNWIHSLAGRNRSEKRYLVRPA